MLCPNCGADNPSGTKQCRLCFADIADGDITDVQGKEPVSEAPSYLRNKMNATETERKDPTPSYPKERKEDGSQDYIKKPVPTGAVSQKKVPTDQLTAPTKKKRIPPNMAQGATGANYRAPSERSAEAVSPSRQIPQTTSSAAASPGEWHGTTKSDFKKELKGARKRTRSERIKHYLTTGFLTVFIVILILLLTVFAAPDDKGQVLSLCRALERKDAKQTSKVFQPSVQDQYKGSEQELLDGIYSALTGYSSAEASLEFEGIKLKAEEIDMDISRIHFTGGRANLSGASVASIDFSTTSNRYIDCIIVNGSWYIDLRNLANGFTLFR